MKRWFILRTDVQGESRAFRWLTEGQPYGTQLVDNVYLPRRTVPVRMGRNQTRDVLRPIIPGYLFAETDDKLANWPSIIKTPGIRDFLSLDGVSKATLSEEAIAVLREIERIENEPKPERSKIFKRKRPMKFKEGLQILAKRLDTRDRYTLERILPELETAD